MPNRKPPRGRPLVPRPDPGVEPQIRAVRLGAVDRQIDELTRPLREPDFPREFIDSVQAARRDAGLPLLGVYPEDHPTVFFVPGEILITPESLIRAREDGALPECSCGCQQGDDSETSTDASSSGRQNCCCEDPICAWLATTEPLSQLPVRVPIKGILTAGLVDLVRDLRRRGFDASLHHLAAAGSPQGIPPPPPPPPVKDPVGKALCQAEAVARPGPWAADTCGEPVLVAILDTGIDVRSRSDLWLAHEQVPRTLDVNPQLPDRTGNVDSLDVLPHDGLLDHSAGHGTFVAGIVQQMAPSANITMFRVLASDGFGTELDIADAMVRAVEGGARIINLSLGLRTLDDLPPLAIRAALDLIGVLTGGAVVVVAAAGNSPGSDPFWPAACWDVVSVAGLTASLQPSLWSTRGPWVTCSTVGEGVRSTFVEGSQFNDSKKALEVFPADAWAVWSGTSFAAPQVAGAVARICQHARVTPREALYLLLMSGADLPGFGKALQLLPVP
jgi:subtilisin family serine protease